LYVELTDDGYQARPTMLDFAHPQLVPRDGSRLVLVVQIENDEITGYLAIDRAVGPAIRDPAAPIKLSDDQLFPLLFGRAYQGPDNLELHEWVNTLAFGRLYLVSRFVLKPPDGPPIVGTLTMRDSNYAFSAISVLAIAGVAPATANLTRTPHGVLTALLPPLDVSHEWSMHGFQGSIQASYFDGSFEANGHLKVSFPAQRPRLQGDITVIATSAEKAWAAVRSHDPAPAITGGLVPIGPTDTMALAGFGTLTLEITKGLKASASFVVDPAGYVTATGTLRAPQTITLVKAYTYGGADEGQANKLVPGAHEWEFPLASTDTIGIGADLHATVSLTPAIVVGPLTLHDVVIVGHYSTRPGAATMLDIAGALNASASASLTAGAEVTGEVDLGLSFHIPYVGDVSVHPFKVHVSLQAIGALTAYADLATKITRTSIADPVIDEATYNLKAHLEAAGKLDLRLQANAGVDLLWLFHPSKSISLDTHFELGNGGFAIDLDHTLGHDVDDKELEFKFSKTDFDPRKFVKVLEGRKSPRAHDRYRGKMVDPKTGEATPARDTEVPLPPAPKPDHEIEVPFKVADHAHQLRLVFGPPPQLELASTPHPISPILEAAVERVRFAMVWAATPEQEIVLKQQEAELERLLVQARFLVDHAERLGTDIYDAELPGVQELAEALVEYGERFDDPEFDGRTAVTSRPLENPDVGHEVDVEPGTDIDVEQSAALEALRRHGFSFDPATGIATQVAKKLTAQRIDGRWTLSQSGVLVAREYDIIPYRDQRDPMGQMFQAHHAIQNEWGKRRLRGLAPADLVNPNLQYVESAAPTIVLRDSFANTPHRKISNNQAKRKTGIDDRTYVVERDAMIDELRELGRVPPEFVDAIGASVDEYFKGLHDNIRNATLRKEIFGTYYGP
jgi:hypothetical protein